MPRPLQLVGDRVKRILDAMDFLKVCGVADSDGKVKDEKLSKVDFFTSHEGLHLPLEEAMTERYKGGHTFVNTGAHFLWIGDRTRQ